MSSFFGLSTDTSFFSNYFSGSSSSTSTSASSGTSNLLGDYSMIKSGTYKKLLKKYYEENPDETNSTIKSSAAADSTTNLLSIKEAASNTKSSADALAATDVESTNRQDLLKKVNSFVSNYNTTIDATKDIESVSILQNAIWMKNQTKKNEDLLGKIGISISADNKLTVDETKFNSASAAALSTVFEGNTSVVSSISQRASQIYTMAGTQAIINQKTTSYNKTGGYNTINSSSLINSLL